MNGFVYVWLFIFAFTNPVQGDSNVDLNDFQIIHTDDDKPNTNVKIIDLIAFQIKHRHFFYAIEVSPKPNFILDYNVFNSMKTKPLFTSITWHLDWDLADNSSLITPYRMFEQINHKSPALMHLTCSKLSESTLDTILKQNVTNILALRGDNFNSQQPYQHAVDLVRAIRDKTEDNISIGVAGYPEKHYDAESFEIDLLYLKQKVDAGADFIITQICFSAGKIINFIEAARSLSITVPIIPGLIIPKSFNQIEIIAQWISIEIPAEMLRRLEPFKNDDSGFSRVMNQMIVDLIHDLKQYSEDSSDFRIPGIQLFTLNQLGNVLEVIEAVGL